jgi:hypothetical protein
MLCFIFITVYLPSKNPDQVNQATQTPSKITQEKDIQTEPYYENEQLSEMSDELDDITDAINSLIQKDNNDVDAMDFTDDLSLPEVDQTIETFFSESEWSNIQEILNNKKSIFV